MYTVQLNDDKTVSTIISQRIAVGYQNSDWFWFLIKPNFQNKKTANSTVTIEYTLPNSKKVKTETLVAKNEYYEEYLKFSLAKYSKLTNEAGWVEIKISVTDSSGSATSDVFRVGISTEGEYHDDKNYDNPVLDGSGYDSQNGCNCDEDAQIARIIEMTKPLVYDSVQTANTKVNTDDKQKVYLGQNVIVVQNGKYLLYSVQQGESGYSVEPVDTYGEGAVWTED